MDENTDIVHMWNKEELSQSEIAGKLGITRSAVAGIAFRLRASGVRLCSRKNGPPPKKKEKKVRPVYRTAPPRLRKKRPSKPVYRKKSVDQAYGTGTLLIDLSPRGCRWPTGMDYKFRHLFCGEEHEGAGPYCNKHKLLLA